MTTSLVALFVGCLLFMEAAGATGIVACIGAVGLFVSGLAFCAGAVWSLCALIVWAWREIHV